MDYKALLDKISALIAQRSVYNLVLLEMYTKIEDPTPEQETVAKSIEDEMLFLEKVAGELLPFVEATKPEEYKEAVETIEKIKAAEKQNAPISGSVN